ncbi:MULTISPECIES: GNAT family N-acetyltransferase [unclassified Halomonas]|uniref:GNAT family N-acetyltransferase n=1 Tax=unclassified Halomonas TaxID=2609666 RepID=UPI00209FDA83|nr:MULTISPECIES: GNAT family protein [unclassified Halomonas]MCP1313423.1 GNAT family N-acetyltransferase [Halomonas sp. 707D7]MCP1326349.1 GNAT family N-acetyltransferase [Halomonas sp. 707D4]
MFITEQQLEGQHVRLEPLNAGHIDALAEAVRDGEGWGLWYASVPHPQEMAAYVERAMDAASHGELAYAVRQLASGDIVGTTRFYDVSAAHRRALIGYTWYAERVRGTAVNAECKLLMLSNLFEVSQAVACEFRTHFFNRASRAAIEALGAKQDGILRAHQILPDGSLRDTVVYSIVASEWPAVRNQLESKLARFAMV